MENEYKQLNEVINLNHAADRAIMALRSSEKNNLKLYVLDQALVAVNDSVNLLNRLLDATRYGADWKAEYDDATRYGADWKAEYDNAMKTIAELRSKVAAADTVGRNDLSEEEHQLAKSGQKIAAIKSIRTRINMGLKEAKDLVEKFYPPANVF